MPRRALSSTLLAAAAIATLFHLFSSTSHSRITRPRTSPGLPVSPDNVATVMAASRVPQIAWTCQDAEVSV